MSEYHYSKTEEKNTSDKIITEGVGDGKGSGSAKRVKQIALIGVMAALIAVCSFISIPLGAVPVTLQTFAVFTCALLLGAGRGTAAVGVYILLGAVGVPVFSGFSGGIGHLAGPTGGYIVGFLLVPLICSLPTKIKNTLPFRALGLLLALTAVYAFGTAWFAVVYARAGESIGIGSVLSKCVVPFILPDALKGALALFVSGRVEKTGVLSR